MELYFAKIKKADGRRAQGELGHTKVYELLTHAVYESFGISEKLDVAYTERGKPYFTQYPGLHFSLSHTSSCVLCAVSRGPIGCDVEWVRPVNAKTMRRIMSAGEAARFNERGCKDEDFFALWTLKESVVKLMDDRSLLFRALDFTIYPPKLSGDSLRCAVYREIPGCIAAVCSQSENPSERPIEVIL